MTKSKRVAEGLRNYFEYSEGSLVTAHAVSKVLKREGYPDPWFDNDVWFEAVDMAFPVLPTKRYKSNYSRGIMTQYGYLRAIRDIKPKNNTGLIWQSDQEEDGPLFWFFVKEDGCAPRGRVLRKLIWAIPLAIGISYVIGRCMP